MLVVDLDNYLSHPDKKLIVHINGVVSGVKRRTNLKIAELSAIFHDIGKLNPNFQEKLKNGTSQGYSNHSYLSMYVFLCYCSTNLNSILKCLNNDYFLLRSIAAIIAHHHGNLPDFENILSEEKNNLKNFLPLTHSVPFHAFIKDNFFNDCASFNIINHPNEENFLSLKIIPKESERIEKPLNFFLRHNSHLLH